MISRVAENCFWLHRYVERFENTARLLKVNRNFLLDVQVPAEHRWHPVIVVSGEEERFDERFSAEAFGDGEIVQDYMVWNEDNPVSIASSVRWARENARTIREVISLEMWESINGTYHWMKRGEGRRVYAEDRDAFYDHLKDAAAHFVGTWHGTMLHEEPFQFMLLGLLLERANQTARILDVKHHQLGDEPDDPGEAAVAAAHALALLRSCSATESYFKRVRRAPSAQTIVPFLILEERFPRSILYSVAGAASCLRDIRSLTGSRAGNGCAQTVESLATSVRQHDAKSLFSNGIHTELTRIINTVAEICNAIHGEFFDPSIGPNLPAILSETSQSQGVES